MEQRERQEERKEAKKKMKSEVLKEVVEERREEKVFALEGGGGQRPRVRALQISLQYHSEAGLWV